MPAYPSYTISKSANIQFLPFVKVKNSILSTYPETLHILHSPCKNSTCQNSGLKCGDAVDVGDVDVGDEHDVGVYA